ncbi:MAG TPA: RidA family protein [Gemmatimonadales bacterium]|jgi:reactive intermediate/imine deaminase
MPSDARSHVEFFPLPSTVRLPFSEAVRVGNLLYLSGQMGTDANARLVGGGIESETRQILTNVGAVLQRHGLDLSAVVKCTVMLADMKEWPAMNQVYLEFFKPPLPARSAFGANGLALGGRVEIECVAALDR